MTEVLDHGDSLTSLTLFKARRLWAHVPANAANLVGLVVTVTSHDYRVFKLIVNGFLNLNLFGGLASVALPLLSKPEHLLVYEFQAVVHGKILADVVNNEVDAALEYPG